MPARSSCYRLVMRWTNGDVCFLVHCISFHNLYLFPYDVRNPLFTSSAFARRAFIAEVLNSGLAKAPIGVKRLIFNNITLLLIIEYRLKDSTISHQSRTWLYLKRLNGDFKGIPHCWWLETSAHTSTCNSYCLNHKYSKSAVLIIINRIYSIQTAYLPLGCCEVLLVWTDVL